MSEFEQKVAALRKHHEELLAKKNEPLEWGNGIYEKYKNPVVTAEHVPLEWKYDFDEHDNPYLMQRIMCNATLNAGAIKWQGKYCLVVRVEGADRKSYFAVAESPNGIDNFRFNTTIAQFMILVNALSECETIPTSTFETFIVLLRGKY